MRGPLRARPERHDGPVSAAVPQIEIPEAELRWRFSRSSGPGGQHVNTTDSRVSLSWDLEASAALDETQRARARRRLAGDLVDGVLTVHASEHRSQARNRDVAHDRLGRSCGRPWRRRPRRRPTRPTKASQARRVETKKRRAETKRLRQRPAD